MRRHRAERGIGKQLAAALAEPGARFANASLGGVDIGTTGQGVADQRIEQGVVQVFPPAGKGRAGGQRGIIGAHERAACHGSGRGGGRPLVLGPDLATGQCHRGRCDREENRGSAKGRAPHQCMAAILPLRGSGRRNSTKGITHSVTRLIAKKMSL